jgi:hypothetical protein
MHFEDKLAAHFELKLAATVHEYSTCAPAHTELMYCFLPDTALHGDHLYVSLDVLIVSTP